MSSRLNIDLKDEELYKAVRIMAIEKGTTVREIVIEALRQWLRQNADRRVSEGARQAAVARLNAVRGQVFGERVLTGDSVDLIREAREERFNGDE